MESLTPQPLSVQPPGSTPSPDVRKPRSGAAPGRRQGAGTTIRVSGRFLELTGSLVRVRPAGRAQSSPAFGTGKDAADAARSGVTPDAIPPLQLSVPKRLVRAALRRNTVKRVLREAWRLAADAGILQVADRSWRFRLKAHPLGSLAAKSQYARAQMRQQARKRAEKAAAQEVPHGAGAGPGADQPSWAQIKRLLRTEADQLLQDAARRLNQPASRRAGRAG